MEKKVQGILLISGIFILLSVLVFINGNLKDLNFAPASGSGKCCDKEDMAKSDINGDGVVDWRDINIFSLCTNCNLNEPNPPDYCDGCEKADLDGDGDIDEDDSALLLKCAAPGGFGFPCSDSGFCCPESYICNNKNKKAKPACCPPGTSSESTVLCGGLNYCKPSQNYCNTLGENMEVCDAQCCDTAKEECVVFLKVGIPPFTEKYRRCEAKDNCPENNLCGFRCCDEGYVCVNGDSKDICKPAFCAPTKEICSEKGQIWCPGEGEMFEESAICCDSFTVCTNHPNGAPLCAPIG